MELFGHTEIFKQLTTDPAQSAGNPYCFVGPKHVGKMHTALCIAEELLDHKKQTNILHHPDIYILKRELNKKTGKTKKNIDLSQIQGLQQFISRNSALQGYRIAIIDQAELCHEQAQQALLKTIEQLPDQVFVIFLVPDKEVLLSTILSRCHIVYFAGLSKKNMQEFSDSIGCTDQQLIQDAHGRPGTLKRWVGDRELYEEYKNQKQEFLSLFGKSFAEKLQAIDALFGTKEDHISTRSKLIDRLDCWLEATREKMLVEPNPQTMVKLMQTIAQTRFQLLQNIHPRLLVEQILLEIP